MIRFFSITKKSVFSFATVTGIFLVVVCIFFLGAHSALAADSTSLQKLGDASGLPQESIAILIARIIRVVLGLLGIVAVILIIYAGFLYMTAAGDPLKIKKSKDILTQTVIGLLIILTSYSITSYILSRLLEALNGNSSMIAMNKKFTEPLAGSLGAGIIDSHYPMRDAVDVPRNTSIFVTFKNSIDLSTIYNKYDKNVAMIDQPSKAINKDTISIFETAKGELKKLNPDEVDVMFVKNSNNSETFVFKPKKYLGNAEKNTGYTVFLNSGIQLEKGGPAFTGKEVGGYAWNFTVSTVVDLTPPKVETVSPKKSTGDGKTEPPNTVVQITFNEPMNPVAASGIYNSKDEKLTFSNIKTLIDQNSTVNGTYEISNGYKTVGFTTFDLCAKDPCGNDVFCLPYDKAIKVEVKAAELDPDPNNYPQAKITNVLYNGLVDASGNSLDGSGDGKAEGPVKDDYVWNFSTSSEIDKLIPKIESLDPKIKTGEISQVNPLAINFNRLLQSSTVNTTSVSVWPEPWYFMWFSVLNSSSVEKKTTVQISHPPFVSKTDGGTNYWPVINNDIKGNNQFCMSPAMGPYDPTLPPPTPATPQCDGTNLAKRFCCNGVPQATACVNNEGVLPTKK